MHGGKFCYPTRDLELCDQWVKASLSVGSEMSPNPDLAVPCLVDTLTVGPCQAGLAIPRGRILWKV